MGMPLGLMATRMVAPAGTGGLFPAGLTTRNVLPAEGRQLKRAVAADAGDASAISATMVINQ